MSESAFETIVVSLPSLDIRELETLQSQAAKQIGVDYHSTLPNSLTQRNCTGIASNPPSASTFVDMLTAAVKEYQTKQYGGSKAATARHQFDTNAEGHLVLRTYAEMLDSHKFRSGYWAACWTIKSESSVQGTVSVHVYNYEDGNMQMRAQREIPSQGITNAQDVIKAIKRAENSLLADLTDKEAITTSLKKIRRILPISKTRMKWSDSAQNAVRLLNARSSGK